MTNETPKPTVYCVQDNKLLVQTDHELYRGWTQADNVSLVKEPLFTWKKAIFSFDLWASCVSFLRWSQKTHHEEAMMTFFYNVREDRWAVDVFPQRPMGMTVKLLEEHPDYALVRAQYGKDWVQAGSIHHHCNMTAFQSGTDREDESDRDGVHITLGKMTEPIVDSHIRVVFDGVTYESNLAHWISPPDWLTKIPAYIWKSDDKLLASTFLGIEDAPFPEEWKKRIIKWQPQGQTVLTGMGIHTEYGEFNGREWGWPSEDREMKKNGNGVSEPSTSQSSTATSGGTLNEKAFAILTEICERMSLTFDEIHNYIVTTDEEMEMLSDQPDYAEESAMRTAVLDAIKKEGFAPLYIEALLDRVL